MRTARRSMTGLLAVLALTATACGSRLTDEQYQIAITAGNGGGGAVTTGDAAADGGAVGGALDAGSGQGGDTTPSGDTGASTGSAEGSTEGSSPGSTGDAGSGDATTSGAGTAGGSSSPGGSTGGGGATAADTRSAPAGGNGGATDVGVTADQITLFNVADISGAVPGIFQDAQLATQAYVAYFNATEGTLYGRSLNLVVRDSQLNASQNRSHYEDACQQAFAAIGSMSAFDEGVSGPVGECGLPDIRTASVNPVTMDTPTVYSADAMSSTLYPTNHYLYWKGQYPGAELRAGMLYINNDTTTLQTRQMIGSSSKVGYNWVVDEAIGLAETNYSSYVIKLKNEGVEFVEFQGDVPQVVRLAQAMRQQNYWPRVFALQQNIYSPKLMAQGQEDIESVEVAVGSALLENIQHYPELQTYREWLKRVSPQAEPTGQGMYAWSASMLFVQMAKQVGPNLTREAILEALSKVAGFDGNGLLPPQDVGARVPSNCHVIVKVENQQFVPVDPPDGRSFVCRGRAEPRD